MVDEVAVGDLDSSARGTGARKNAGKPQWWQLPVFVLPDISVGYLNALIGVGLSVEYPTVLGVIESLGAWQRGHGRPNSSSTHLTIAMGRMLYLLAAEAGIEHPSRVNPPLRALESTVRVLEFGAVKYKPGNWAKGMPWSVCLSCALSHLLAAEGGELLDKESGISHLAHAMCNLIFLKAYEQLYPEGDDRLTEWAFVGTKDQDTFMHSYEHKLYWFDERGFHCEPASVYTKRPPPPGENI